MERKSRAQIAIRQLGEARVSHSEKILPAGASSSSLHLARIEIMTNRLGRRTEVLKTNTEHTNINYQISEVNNHHRE